MRNFLLTLGLVCSLSFYCTAQLSKQAFSQYTFNPYLFNPSFIATNKKAEANLLYGQQWSGIKDGPKVLHADFQYPLNDRMAIGLNINEDRTLLLSSNSVMATFGYKIYLGHDHTLGFGLSGGFSSNRVHLEELTDIELNDPVVYKLANDKGRFNSQFGLHYEHKKFTFGFSLLQLVYYNTFNAEKSNDNFLTPLENIVIHSSYDIQLSDQVSVHPSFLYQANSNERNITQASVLFSFKDQFRLGAGYRQYLGPNIMASAQIKNFVIGYAFSFPTRYPLNEFGTGNEVQLKWLFGDEIKKKTDPLYEDYNKKLRKIESHRKKYRKMSE